jgi:hypothetical protein
MTAGSGLKSPVPFLWYDPDSSCWRTYQASLLGGWDPFLGAFPRSGMMRSGRLFPLPKSARVTAGIASGLWATPAASDARGSHGGGQGRSLRTDIHTMKHTGQVPVGVEESWPTPTATDARDMPARSKVSKKGLGDRPRSAHALSLMVAVQVWPTPTVTGNNNRKGSSERAGDGLGTAVKAARNLPPVDAVDATDQLPLALVGVDAPRRIEILPTPCARDHRDRGRDEVLARTGKVSQFTLPRAVATENIQEGSADTGSLNPTWVAWLMGYPTAWLNSKPSAMPSSRKSRSDGRTSASRTTSRKATEKKRRVKQSTRSRVAKRTPARKK